MTVDKLGSTGTNFGHEATVASKAKSCQPIDLVTAQSRSVALAQQNAPAAVAKLAPSTVSVSMAAKELFSAVNSASDEDEFDQEKVERIRQEIASGRFPIDEDRLARKFRELEQQLGDLGG